MTGETNLQALLAGMSAQLRPERFVFTTVREAPAGAQPVVSVVEDEGLTLVLRQDEADRLRLEYEGVFAMVTLRVYSALEAVGLTAAVATTLAAADMSCNVVAGFFHDHLFVQTERGEEAIALLDELARRGSAGSGASRGDRRSDLRR
jgi:uncharacterized protein